MSMIGVRSKTRQNVDDLSWMLGTIKYFSIDKKKSNKHIHNTFFVLFLMVNISGPYN